MIRIDDVGILDSLDIIFSGVLVGGIDVYNEKLKVEKKMAFRNCLGWFRTRFPDNIFVNNSALYWDILNNLKVRVFGVEQLKTIIRNNWDAISDSPYIDISDYKTNKSGGALSREEKIEAYTEDIVEDFCRLSNMQVTEDEFNSACEIYVEYFKNEFYKETVMNMAIMVSNPQGLDVKLGGRRSKNYRGKDDADKYYLERKRILSALEEDGGTKHYVLNAEALQRKYDGTDDDTAEPLMDYGIAELDAIKREMRRGWVVEFMGAPKGGKTTICQFEVARALKKGLNVAVWPLEGSKEEWEAAVIACLIRMDESGSMNINRADIQDIKFETDDEKSAFISMRQRLYCSPDIGRLSFITGAGYIETFEDELTTHYESKNAYDIIVMDSPINFMSKHGVGKVERLSAGFMQLKNYVNNKAKFKPLCFITAQLKQEVVDQARKNPNETLDVTAGGDTAETIRTPDEVIGLFSSKNERSMGQIKIIDIASRHSKNFDDCFIGCDFGCSYFFSDPELNA